MKHFKALLSTTKTPAVKIQHSNNTNNNSYKKLTPKDWKTITKTVLCLSSKYGNGKAVAKE